MIITKLRKWMFFTCLVYLFLTGSVKANQFNCIVSKGHQVCNHAFGGSIYSLKAIPEGKYIHVDLSTCKKIRIDFSQVSRTLSMPLGDPQYVEQCSSDVTYIVPSLKHEILLQAELSYQNSVGEWLSMPTATHFLKVYPSDLLKPLRDWSKDHDLVLINSPAEFELFLDTNNIIYQYRPSIDVVGETPQNIVWVYDFDPDRDMGKISKWLKNAKILLLFYQSYELLPMVRTTEIGDQTILHIQMAPSIFDWTKPLVQKSLLNLLYLTNYKEIKQ
jgi:hypothetical protein